MRVEEPASQRREIWQLIYVVMNVVEGNPSMDVGTVYTHSKHEYDDRGCCKRKKCLRNEKARYTAILFLLYTNRNNRDDPLSALTETGFTAGRRRPKSAVSKGTFHHARFTLALARKIVER